MVINRFRRLDAGRAPASDAATKTDADGGPMPGDEAGFLAALNEAHAALAAQRGYLDGAVGRNVDDPTLWVLWTRWEGPGAYRRALSAYDVKVRAWSTLGASIDEPSAYEIAGSSERLNDAQPRGTG